MSREIKFREWSFSYKEMTYSDDLPGGLEQFFSNGCGERVSGPMQFTGLTDIDGKEIYCGDICEVMYYTPFGDKTDDFYGAMEVKFWMGEFILVSGKERVGFLNFADSVSSEYVSNLGTVLEFSEVVNVRVIGNIHQNKDLLS